jgi:hypothetical protein
MGETPQGKIAPYDFNQFLLNDVSLNQQSYITDDFMDKLEKTKSTMDAGMKQLKGIIIHA